MELRRSRDREATPNGECNYDFDVFTGRDTTPNRVIESLSVENSNRPDEFEDELLVFGDNSYPITEANSDSISTISDGDYAIASDHSTDLFGNINTELSEATSMMSDFTSGEYFLGIAS